MASFLVLMPKAFLTSVQLLVSYQIMNLLFICLKICAAPTCQVPYHDMQGHYNPWILLFKFSSHLIQMLPQSCWKYSISQATLLCPFCNSDSAHAELTKRPFLFFHKTASSETEVKPHLLCKASLVLPLSKPPFQGFCGSPFMPSTHSSPLCLYVSFTFQTSCFLRMETYFPRSWYSEGAQLIFIEHW